MTFSSSNAEVCASCSHLAEADHRIANHLSILASQIRQNAKTLARRPAPPDGAEVALILRTVCVQIDANSGLHRLLSARGPTSSVDLGTQLSNVCGALRAAVSTDIVIAEDLAPQCGLPINQMLPVIQIVTELITNAIKYGRIPGEPGAIRVSCRKDGVDGPVVVVADRGPGKTDEKLEPGSRGLGSRLVLSLTQQIGGSIAYLPGNPGLTVRLTLNDAAPKPASATFETPETSAPR